MHESTIELFTLKCAAIRSCVEKSTGGIESAADLDIKRDPAIRDYLSEISLRDRQEADRMAEYYKLFYLLENHIRDFVMSIMTDVLGEDWWEIAVPENIRESARRSRERELNAGVTPRAAEMIEYITFGELAEIIKTNWPRFAGMFTSQKGLESVTGRLNTLRGPIMHCGVLAEDEVIRLKLSVRDWFKLFVTDKD